MSALKTCTYIHFDPMISFWGIYSKILTGIVCAPQFSHKEMHYSIVRKMEKIEKSQTSNSWRLIK